jgi:Holliday junction DNA helicase RuvA
MALESLGFKRAEAFGAVARVAEELGSAASAESLVKAGLKELSG